MSPCYKEVVLTYLALGTGGLADEAALDQGLGHTPLLALHGRWREHDRESGRRKLVINLHSVHGQPHAGEAAVGPDARCVFQGQASSCGHEDLLGSVVHQADLHCRDCYSDIQCVAESAVRRGRQAWGGARASCTSSLLYPKEYNACFQYRTEGGLSGFNGLSCVGCLFNASFSLEQSGGLMLQ